MAELPNQRKRTIGYLVAGAALIAAVACAGWFGLDRIQEKRQAKLANAYVQEILTRLNLTATPDFHARIDMVRTFINDNSIYSVDKAFWANRGNQAAFAASLLAYAKGETSEPAHMECSTRTNLMGLIFRALGYQTRVVAIFDTDRNLTSHSFLEVMNPETGRWETQDGSYDIYWRDKSSSERISVAEAAEDLDAIEPCGREKCGWDHASREGSKAERFRRLLDIISLTQKERDLRFALYTSRADLGRIYSKRSKRGTFCEVEAKRCQQGFYDIKEFSSYAPGLEREAQNEMPRVSDQSAPAQHP